MGDYYKAAQERITRETRTLEQQKQNRGSDGQPIPKRRRLDDGSEVTEMEYRYIRYRSLMFKEQGPWFGSGLDQT